MKIVSKLHPRDKRGETIIEVLVAFALLSIMLVLFSQGITAASKSDVKAMQTRTAADKAMLDLQKCKVEGIITEDGVKHPNKSPVSDINNKVIYRQIYQIEDEQTGEFYTYVVYSIGD